MTRKEKIKHHTDWNECYHHFNECGEWIDRTIMIDQISKWIEQHFY